MRFLRLLGMIAAFLIIAVPFSQPLFSQQGTDLPKHINRALPQRQPKRPPRAAALAAVINELLDLYPLAPGSPDEKDSGDANASSNEEDKPPADDAPIKTLVEYWSQNRDTNAPKLSDKVRERFLEACEDRPELIHRLVNFLPESAATHDRLYRLLTEEPENYSNWKEVLRNWLRRNSLYFRDELIADARASSGYSLRSLAKLDWDAARPIVETFAAAGDAQMGPVALSLLYERAQQDGDSTQVEKYRALLKAIVANRQSPHDARWESLESLLKGDWNGQEEWFVSLFSDPTLTGTSDDEGKPPTTDAAPLDNPKAQVDRSSQTETLVLRQLRRKVLNDIELEALDKAIQLINLRNGDIPNDSYFNQSSVYVALEEDADKWLPIVGKLIGHNQRAIHNAAVKCLVDFLNQLSASEKSKKEITLMMAPWLTDSIWAGVDGRLNFIQSLVDTQVPELLSGLIWVLEHDEDEENRAAAAEALTQYRDPAAIPALRRALEREEDEERREKIVTALAECGGFSDDEMAAAIEAYAKIVVTEEGEQEIVTARAGESEKPLPLKVSIGRILHENEMIKVTEGMAVRLFERAKALRASQPAVARKILSRIESAPLRVAEVNLVERIGAGWADVESLTLALKNRDSIRKSAVAELYSLIRQGGYAAGVAVTILNDEREKREALAGTDAKAQLALLAGARYLRDKLPVELAGKLLDSTNRALAKAADSYLEVEDSAEARNLILARRRGEAYILGDGAGVGHRGSGNWEEAMRKEIKSHNGLEAIYALAISGLTEIDGVIIRVRGGKAEISLHDVEGRRDARWLTESEFEGLKSFTSRQEVEDLGPEHYICPHHRGCYEYLRLTKDGGRRIVLNGLRRAPKNPTLHEELSGLFYRLSKSGEFVTRYAIEDKIPGIEVLLADKKQDALMVCGEGSEIRVLVAKKDAEYKLGFVEAAPEWREFSSGKTGGVTDDPAACRVLSMISTVMKHKWNNHYRDISLPTRSGDAWVYSSDGEDSGVWKYEPGAEPVKIISGSYEDPVLTPDGKWLVAIKTINERGETSSQLVRQNLQTAKEFPLNVTDGDFHAPVKYIAAHGKVLLGQGGPLGQVGLGAINYLLDPETGTLQQVKGEFRPLMERFARELQPAGNPNGFWAAVPDWNKNATNIGRYDIRNFAFTPLVELPELILRNSDFWVDAAAGKIWITYQGQLLRIPLPAKTK